MLRLFHHFAGKLKRRQHIFLSDPGIFTGNFINGKARRQKINDVGHGDPGAANTWLAKTHRRINGDNRFFYILI